MTRPDAVGVGVIGLGFMGAAHIVAYRAAQRAGYPCRLLAVCDRVAERRTGRAPAAGNFATGAEDVLFDPREVRACTEAEVLLADDTIELVSICTPTPTHVDLAVRALQAGKHVLVEKPVALTSSDVRRVTAAADAAGRICMPAMCVRFWPGWSWLKEQIDQRTFGAVRSATFERVGNSPDWSASFYQDTARSGGALFDLHIHDADFVRWCLGEPDAVISTGSDQHVTTIYRYAAGPPHVLAEGGWLGVPGYPFRMRYRVVFERAIAEFDLGGDPPLRLTRDGRTEAVPLQPLTGYDLEIRHLLDAINSDGPALWASIADAEVTTRLLEAEKRSLATGTIVPVRGVAC